MAPLPGWKPLTNICDATLQLGEQGKRCDFAALTELIRNGITDLILISTLLVVVAAIVAGMKLVTSGGNPSKLTEVKEMFTKIIIGYAVVLTAWLVVYTITSVLLNSEFSLIMN